MPVSEILFPSSWTKTCLSQPEGFKVRQPRGFPTVINLRKSWLVTPPQPEGLKVRQPRATPWEIVVDGFAACRAAGSNNQRLSHQCSQTAFPAALEAANVSLDIPRALPWAVSTSALRAEERHVFIQEDGKRISGTGSGTI